MDQNAIEIKKEAAELFGGEEPSYNKYDKEDDELIFEEFQKIDPADIINDLREARIYLNRVNRMIEGEKKLYGIEYMKRDVIEELYSVKMSLLYNMARGIHPLAPYGIKCLGDAVAARMELEDMVGVYTTRVSRKNIRIFMSLLTEDLAEDIGIGRRDAIGAIRAENGRSYGAGILVYWLDFDPFENLSVLRIEWLYVHEHFRGKGVADSLIAEMVWQMKKSNVAAMTASFTVGSTLEPVIGRKFSSWRFSFEPQMERDTLISIEDINNIDELQKYVKLAKPVSAIEEKNIPGFLEKALEEDEYEGYLWGQMRNTGYIDPKFSCFVGERKSPTVVLMAHKTPSGIYRVEYVRLTGKDLRPLLAAVAFFIWQVIGNVKGAPVIDIPIMSDELDSFLGKLIPSQRGALLLTGVLTENDDLSNYDEEMINSILSISKEEMEGVTKELNDTISSVKEEA